MLIALWFVLASNSAHALGKSPAQVPTDTPPIAAAVAGYSMPDSGQAFLNYAIWDHSHLPAFLQLYHCAGMALFARQVFNWASFDPTRAPLPARERAELLREIFEVPTPTLPGTRARR